MKRVPLNQGDKINLNNREYTIDTVIGDGATCIVYSAYYEDNLGLPHRVNIKECYPYNADVIREGETLVWMSENERIQKQLAFTTTYKKLMNNQKGNYIVHAFDIGRCNETLYIVMDANDGVTFDNDNANNLSDILSTVKLLAYVVGEYHKNGYLHLDIKPSNFLVYPRPSDHIILFDMDTITSIEDIKSGKVQVCSYSDDWAAPEQKQGKINKLCPATDMYAIGAVLFEKVMGRQVECGDSCLFAEWEFDGELFEDVNPKIKRLLSNIFRKTISANIKCRYQSANDLIKALAEAIKIANSDIYLKGDDICCSGCFFGRENELNLIKSYFDSKKKAVFLHGFGGIGKTEIARRYAQLNSKKYDNVLFIKYNGNDTLQELLNDIDIVNFDTDDSKEKWRKLRNLLDEHTLVIVDNFDIELGADNGLKLLFETKANILVATRTDFSSVYNGDKYGYIEVKELANSELEQMFITNAKITSITEDDRCILKKIFKLIENHTYATELLAKQMWYSGWSVEELYQKVKSGFASLENVERIIVNKDEKQPEGNSFNILRAVYNISDLTEGQKQVLRDMVLLDCVQVTKDVYREIALTPITAYRTERILNHYESLDIQISDDIYAKMPDKTLNSFNQLVDLGYILHYGQFFTLHSIIKELALLELKPTLNNCPVIHNYMFRKIERLNYFDSQYDADEAEAFDICEFVFSVFQEIDLSLQEHLELMLRWLYLLYDSADSFVASSIFFNDSLKYIELFNHLEKIAFSLSDDEMQFKILYIIFKAYLNECDYRYLADEEVIIQRTNVRNSLVLKAFLNVLKVSEDNPRKLNDIYCEISYSANYFAISLRENDPQKLVLTAYSKHPELLKLDYNAKEHYGFELNEKELQAKEEDRRKSIEEHNKMAENWHKMHDDRYDKYDEEEKLVKAFRESKDKVDFAHSVAFNEKYDIESRNEYLDSFVDELICFEVFSVDDRWDEFQKILKIRYEFDREKNWEESLYVDIAYRAIRSLFDDSLSFDELMQLALECDLDYISGLCYDFYVCTNTQTVFKWSKEAKKGYLVLPYFVRLIEADLSDYYDNKNKDSLRDIFRKLSEVQEYAEIAIKETEQTPELQKVHAECVATYKWLTDLINKATNKTFDLKPDKE
ncbi:MAG: hypothetical protein UHK60_09120 [Acutalibacteraceae bacterium]|nr:hypothetical protein [Acutalibacteraceae bacterium]